MLSTNSTVDKFVDKAIDLPWRHFQSPEFGAKVPEGIKAIFGNTRTFL